MTTSSRSLGLSSVADSASPMILYLFAIAMVLETFHMAEHVAQMYEHAVLGLGIAESHGIIFFLDLEWNHMLFNGFYLGLLGTVFVRCRIYQRKGAVAEKRVAWLAFNAAIWVQAYHVFEHTVRMGQFFGTGCTPCPGLLGSVLDLVYLHGTIDAIVYVFPMVAFVSYGFYRNALNSTFVGSFTARRNPIV